MVPGIRELGEWVVGSKTHEPRSSVTRFVKILDLGRIQRTWERRQVWRTEGRRQVVGCSGCRNCFSAFSLHDSILFGSAVGLGLSTLLCEVRVVHVLHAKACMSFL